MGIRDRLKLIVHSSAVEGARIRAEVFVHEKLHHLLRFQMLLRLCYYMRFYQSI